MDRSDREKLIFDTEQKMLPENKRRCPSCYGTGFIDATRQRICEDCAGTGYANRYNVNKYKDYPDGLY